MVNSWLVCICNAMYVFDIRNMKALKNVSSLSIIGVSCTILVVFLKNICEMQKSVFISQFVKIGASASVFGMLYFLCVWIKTLQTPNFIREKEEADVEHGESGSQPWFT